MFYRLSNNKTDQGGESLHSLEREEIEMEGLEGGRMERGGVKGIFVVKA
jgi:hypothetical protein